MIYSLWFQQCLAHVIKQSTHDFELFEFNKVDHWPFKYVSYRKYVLQMDGTCNPILWGPLGPIFDKWSSFDNLAISWSGIKLLKLYSSIWLNLKKITAKMPLNFNAANWRAKIIRWGRLFSSLLSKGALYINNHLLDRLPSKWALWYALCK